MMMSNRFARLLGSTLVVAGLLSPAAAQAQTLVTHYFEGEVDYSDSSLVSVGDRLRGTFTYDLDWEDRLPDSPDRSVYIFPPDWPLETFPLGSRIGMSYTVGALSHHTEELFELIIHAPDFLELLSDQIMGPFRPPLGGGYLDLLDDAGTALSSDRPPAILSLAAFSEAAFSGFDGQGGSFTVILDVLRPIPEPSTLILTVVISLPFLCGAPRLCMRLRQRRQYDGE